MFYVITVCFTPFVFLGKLLLLQAANDFNNILFKNKQKKNTQKNICKTLVELFKNKAVFRATLIILLLYDCGQKIPLFIIGFQFFSALFS